MSLLYPDVNECDSSPCLNGARCVDLLKRYVCRCRDDYTGVTCERREYHSSFIQLKRGCLLRHPQCIVGCNFSRMFTQQILPGPFRKTGSFNLQICIVNTTRNIPSSIYILWKNSNSVHLKRYTSIRKH